VTGSALVRYEVADGVCTLVLDNPERNNGWNRDMEQQYFELLDRAAADTHVRAIVVTGVGRSFCPGLDTRRLEDAAGPVGLQLEGRRSQHHALTVPKPMIAAINGGCAGIGLVQALVCDVRFVAKGAKLSTAYAKLGIPAEYGLSWLLPRLIGVEWALDLLLSARPVEAEEAQRIGLVSRCANPPSSSPRLRPTPGCWPPRPHPGRWPPSGVRSGATSAAVTPRPMPSGWRRCGG
jgi:enoyl-CoA hydratase/carnithine racemase